MPPNSYFSRTVKTVWGTTEVIYRTGAAPGVAPVPVPVDPAKP
jgi:hypothetical protein